MKMRVALSLSLMLMTASGCSKSGKDDAPQGQVVATVSGQEITLAEVLAETGSIGASGNPQEQKLALQRIIVRRILAEEARRRDLDSTPIAAILQKAAEDSALAQVLTRKVTENAPKVSADEVAEFLRTYPFSVSQRHILSIDQFTVEAAPADLSAQLKPTKTMAEAEAILQRNRLNYRKTAGQIDSLTLDPNFAAQIIESQGREIFMYPEGSNMIIGSITASRIEPITGENAERAARSLLTQKRTNDMVSSALGKILLDGQKTVKINPAYQDKGAAAPAKPLSAGK